MTYKKTLLATQLYIHTIFMVGLVMLPWYVTIPTLIIGHIVFVGFCGTVFFHRIVTHKNRVNPVAEKILLGLSWLGGVSSAIAWAGVHRKHHRFSDTSKDPHSPKYLGKLRTYCQLSDNDSDAIKYVPDLLKKPLYVFQHRHYFQVLGAIHLIGVFVLPFQLYWMLLIVPAFLMWFVGSMVNIFGHNANGSKNSLLLGILSAGEGWHRNHHDEPGNYSFRHSLDWGQYLYRIVK